MPRAPEAPDAPDGSPGCLTLIRRPATRRERGTAPPTIDGVASERRRAAGRARPAGPRRARYPARLGDHDPNRAHHERDNQKGERDRERAP